MSSPPPATRRAARASVPRPAHAADLRGASRLAIDAVTGVVDLVEAVHANVVGLPGLLDASGARSGVGGLAGWVYRRIRGTTRRVGSGIDAALATLAPVLDRGLSLPQRDAVVAALNGVLGDHLADTANPLAIPMRLRREGRPLSLGPRALRRDLPQATGRVLVLAHGLCMNDRQWCYGGHDHGAALARERGYTPLYLHYNTGRRISDNGRALSALLERLARAWPVPIDELVVVGHSMGGLVARAACAVAQDATARGHDIRWLPHLRRLVFLGTPHHGAPLERAGSWVDLLLGASPYTAPFARLGRIRSAGIRDLRHGNVRRSDWHGGDDRREDRRSPTPLPPHVAAYAIAATTQAPRGDGHRDALRGDGLVQVASAFGQHAQPRFRLRIPPSRRALVYGTHHLGLLGSHAVYAHLRRWLR